MSWTFPKLPGHLLNAKVIQRLGCLVNAHVSWACMLIPVTRIRETNGTRLPGQAQSQTSPPVLFQKGSGSWGCIAMSLQPRGCCSMWSQ